MQPGGKERGWAKYGEWQVNMVSDRYRESLAKFGRWQGNVESGRGIFLYNEILERR